MGHQVKAVAAFVLLLAGVAPAMAQFVTGSFFMSSDSDSFEELRVGAGWTAANGFGVAAGAVRYSAPGWSETGALLAGTYREYSRQRQVDASIGVLDLAGSLYAVGLADFMHRWDSGNALGFSIERQIVNSQGGIEDEIVQNTAVLVGDYVFTPRFNVGLAGGLTYFSDGNVRPVLRTRWNYELVAQYGLNAYLKTRSYTNSDPNRPQYYSPSRLNEASLGLSSRWLAHERVVISLALDAGVQSTESDSEPIWGVLFGLASPRNEPIRWNVGLLATNTSSFLTTQSGAYRYLSAAAQISIPF
jgi:hypothetical protein